ncbi:MAG: FKBP-type peptidyl-prolyl cis-trans isomerase [Candidatus Thermoplasmatota archaeon]|nr:FKBP-type peptidyl-prolyl cis-trans isomerase [Candidatus Thermoplasmatota archaeon]
MDDEQLCILTIVAGIVLLLGLVGYTIYDEEIVQKRGVDKKEGILLAQEGDEVSVDYTGYFTNGLVFDTSIGAVARNDSMPKSAGFMARPVYDDLTFKVGSDQMIKGFDRSILGKKVGQTYTITVPPEQGYGTSDPDLIYYLNSTMTIDLVQVLPLDYFKNIFPVVDYRNDTRFDNPVWKWGCDIVSYDETTITIRHLPVYQQKVQIFPWNSTVVDISTQKNTITLHHHVDEITKGTRIDIMALSGFDNEWFQKANAPEVTKENRGFVTASGGVIVLDFNREVSGKTLIFTITVNDIRRDSE